MTKIRYLSIAAFTITFLLSLYYIRDLKQLNAESLFLDHTQIKTYQKFLKSVHEAKILIVKARAINKELSEAEIHHLDNTVATLQEEFALDDFQFLNHKVLYGTLLKDQLKSPLLPLLQKESYAFLVSLPSDTPSTKVANLTSKISKAIKLPLIFGGLPYTNQLLDFYSESIKTTVFPLLFSISFLLLLYFTASLRTTLLLFFAPLSSFFISLALIKLLYSSLNMITSIVPLLMMVLNLSLVLHLYYSLVIYKDARTTIKRKTVPLFLVISTTVVGFGSLYTSSIVAIKQFALLTTLLLLLSSLLTILWMHTIAPAIAKDPLDFKKYRFGFHRHHHFFYQLFFKKISSKTILLSSLLILALGSYSFFNLSILTDVAEYFPKDSLFQEHLKELNRTLIGNPNFEITIKRQDASDLSYNDFKFFSKLEFDLLSINSTGIKKIISPNAIIKEGNALYTGNNDLPADRFAYFALWSKVHPALADSYPLPKVYRLTLTGETLNHDQYWDIYDKIKTKLQQLDTAYQSSVDGLQFNLMLSQSSLISTLSLSFFSSLLIICLLCYFYFRNFKILSLFLFINIMPILCGVIFIKCGGASLNIATVMTFSISLGMVVDSTIHITHDKLTGIAYEEHFQTTLLPIITGTLLLVIAFATFAIEAFLPIRQVGIMLAFILPVGALYDLFVLPKILLYTTSSLSTEN
ncbi:MAG: hypothetical protein HQK50_09055 [Oligoflexia bacterium]|nr:hypothetical protein [Oligoflexia bacterium]